MSLSPSLSFPFHCLLPLLHFVFNKALSFILVIHSFPCFPVSFAVIGNLLFFLILWFPIFSFTCNSYAFMSFPFFPVSAFLFFSCTLISTHHLVFLSFLLYFFSLLFPFIPFLFLHSIHFPSFLLMIVLLQWHNSAISVIVPLQFRNIQEKKILGKYCWNQKRKFGVTAHFSEGYM